MNSIHELEADITRQLGLRGLRRASSGPLAFVHRGRSVRITVDQSVYRGYFVTVHDSRPNPSQQFRARAGAYDWNAIAASIREVAERQLATLKSDYRQRTGSEPANQRLASDLNALTGTGPDSVMSIKASPAVPGRVRVSLGEMDLDPVTVMQIYAAVRHALPRPRSGTADPDPALL